MSEKRFDYDGTLEGHRDWVTAVACPQTYDTSFCLLSASRDKTVAVWKKVEAHSENDVRARPIRRLEGHSDFVQDLALSNSGEFVLTASWDRSLRLWNLKTGACITKFLGHKKDALSVAFSPDNRQIVSGGRDNQIKLWNVKGDCMFTMEKDAHSDWVNCVRFSPTVQTPLIVSGSNDNTVKVWNLSEFRCSATLRGHTGGVNTVTVSPDGSLCASSGRDGKAKLWDLGRSEHLYELDCPEPINSIAFSPNRFWLCAATETSIRIWDLETKDLVTHLEPVCETKRPPQCTSIAWSADGNTLYSGHSDNSVRQWTVRDLVA